MQHRITFTSLLMFLLLDSHPAVHAQESILTSEVSTFPDAQEITLGEADGATVADDLTVASTDPRSIQLQIHTWPIYFSDCAERSSVWEYRADTATQRALFTRASGSVSAFAFAPRDPSRLYFTDANRDQILRVSLASSSPNEEVAYTHSTYVRDVAWGRDNNLYFSEASGAGDDGKIYRLEDDGTASLFFTVRLSEIHDYWGGNFGFAPDGTLLLTSGNTSSAGLYEADVPTGTLTRLLQLPYLTGFAFDPGGALHVTYHGTQIDILDLEGLDTRVAHIDPSQVWICDVGFRDLERDKPNARGLWVMPQAIGETRLDFLKPTGLLDYRDKASGIAMTDAPFGGTLALVLNSADAIPTADVYYYRFRYRRQGSTAWNDLTAPVSVHYARYRTGTTPTFPTLRLGPHNVKGMNLYRFRPHARELSALAPSASGSFEWPKIPIPGDIYRGFLDTLPLDPGPYDVRLEVFNQAGKPSPNGAFEMVVPTGADLSGKVLTAAAPMTDRGYQFVVHIDNRPASAEIEAPRIGARTTDICGFLRNDFGKLGEVRLGWQAWHPSQFAVYRLEIVRGEKDMGFPPLLGSGKVMLPLEVGSTLHKVPNRTGRFSVLSPVPGFSHCIEAAFAVTLHVYAKATTGNGYRIKDYDARRVRAFALRPTLKDDGGPEEDPRLWPPDPD